MISRLTHAALSGLTGGGFRIKDASNVIIRNINFGIPTGSGDAVALDGATKVWIGVWRRNISRRCYRLNLI